MLRRAAEAKRPLGKHQNLEMISATETTYAAAKTWAHTTTIPTNRVIDASAAASSMTARNMTASPARTDSEHSSIFVLSSSGILNLNKVLKLEEFLP